MKIPPFPVEDVDQRRHLAIKTAVADLEPTTGADFAVAIIEWILSQKPSVVPRRQFRPMPPSKAAKQLHALAAAIIEVENITRNLSGAAVRELDDTRLRQGLDWGANGALALPRNLSKLLDDQYPGLAEAAEEAAKNLDRRKVGRPRDQYPLAVATLLAGQFEMLTGKQPAISGGETEFSRFVTAIFVAGGIDGNPDHYSKQAAKLHRDTKIGGKGAEIGWPSLLV